jgi:hypothetical protein
MRQEAREALSEAGNKGADKRWGRVNLPEAIADNVIQLPLTRPIRALTLAGSGLC